MKFLLATLALTAATVLASPAPNHHRPAPKKGVNPELCEYSRQQHIQEAACAGDYWARMIASRCGLKVKCSDDFSSTFGISDKAKREPEPMPMPMPQGGGGGPQVGCAGFFNTITKLFEALLASNGFDPNVYEALIDAIEIYKATCPVTGGPMLPDPTRPGGPITPDKPSQGGPIIPDRPNPGGPIKPSD